VFGWHLIGINTDRIVGRIIRRLASRETEMLAPLSVLILVAAVATGVEIGLPAARQGNQITPVTVRITSTVVSTATATITSKAFCWTTAAAPAPAVNPCRRKRDLFLDTPVVYGEDKSIIPVRELFNPSPLLK